MSLPAGALLAQPLVYAWITAAGAVRYWACRARGWRALSVITTTRRTTSTFSDRLVIWPMATAEAAEQAERNILAALGPALNHQRPHASLHVVGADCQVIAGTFGDSADAT